MILTICALGFLCVHVRYSQRKMPWAWRGEFYPANRGEYETIRNQLEAERMDRVSVQH